MIVGGFEILAAERANKPARELRLVKLRIRALGAAMNIRAKRRG
jgi:hypothetical protein